MKSIQKNIDNLETERDIIIHEFYLKAIKIIEDNFESLGIKITSVLMPDTKENFSNQVVGYWYPHTLLKTERFQAGWQMTFFHRKDNEPARLIQFICTYDGKVKIILKSRSENKEKELVLKKDKISPIQSKEIKKFLAN